MVSCTFDQQMRYRLGYLFASLLLMMMTVSVPNTVLYEKCSEVSFWGEICNNSNSKAAISLVYVLVIFSFFTVQGSDPGYIIDENSSALSDFDHHEAFLQHPHDYSDEIARYSMTEQTNCREMSNEKFIGGPCILHAETNQVDESRIKSTQAEPGLCTVYPSGTGDSDAHTGSFINERAPKPLPENNNEVSLY